LKFQKIELTAVQGHPMSSILVPIILVINSNFSRICYRSRITVKDIKMLISPTPSLIDAP